MTPKPKDLQSDLTLRFKFHKTTILLLCQPTQTFVSIKENLLGAIKQSGCHEIHGSALPEDPEDVVFGVLRDKSDFSKGWVNLEIPEFDEADAKGKGVKKGSVMNQTPLGAGLREGAVLAFKFKALKTENEMELDDEWDVIMPSFDDEIAE